MKKILLIILVSISVQPCWASHIVGGEMIYQYTGPGPTANTSNYTITLKLFRDQTCTNCALMPPDVFIGIFNNDNGNQFPGTNQPYDVIKNNELQVPVDPFPPCINNAPYLNYHVGIFILNVTLPDNTNGYTVSYQTCCRVNPLANVYNTVGGIGGTGATYSCTIPGVHDNSPQFASSVDAICRHRHFTLKFNATDPDGDSLVYSFAPAYNGGGVVNSGNVNPSPPAYRPVAYINGFTFGAPLGNLATIDPKTGIISGIAPDVGKYVVCVSVSSYRNGAFLAEHRKDFIVNVTDCDFAGAQLTPQPVTCDGFTVNFSNSNNSPLNLTYYWDFGDPASGSLDTSTMPSPVHVYSDTGTFVYQLVINRGQQCSDSATQIQNVYPGFFPGFTSSGTCVKNPVQFTDTTKSRYGLVNSWAWNFGDPSNSGDSSHIQNPSYTYQTEGSYLVQLTVGNAKGCQQTVLDTLNIITKPQFNVTNDTLICSIDTVQLQAWGAAGTISWTPNYNISNPNSFTPLVSPKVTTTYTATLTEAPGCFASLPVVVNVVNSVSLNMPGDTTICQTDSVKMLPISDGLHYLWSPATGLSSDTAKSPEAAPLSTTTYHLIAHIGKCATSGQVTYTVVPYPKASTGPDTTICFPSSYQLHASGGVSYLWSPSSFLDNPGIADPITSPPQSIRYTVAVMDNQGCPKPSFDSVLVTVQQLHADAGPRDTNIVVNQPLQLNATATGINESASFVWTPSTGLNNPGIANPVAILFDSQVYVVTVRSLAGCDATDTINVTVYKIDPGLYVPNGFTPNGDGINDVFKPILVGMKSLTYFKVYNRDGQLIYSTNIQNQGWDGTFHGIPQDAAVYVWMAEGIDYEGHTIFKKGSVTLVR